MACGVQSVKYLNDLLLKKKKIACLVVHIAVTVVINETKGEESIKVEH